MSDADAARPTVGITGAYGYVGALLRRAFDDAGWRTVALVRSARRDDAGSRPFDLSDGAVPIDAVRGLDVLVHGAWDLSIRDRETMWRVNVEGSRRLLQAAEAVPRVIFISTMSAYPGTGQWYGQAKLAVEDEAVSRGQCVIRPGLIYGRDAGGMAGALTRLARLPVVPTVAGPTRQFPVHADDLARTVIALATHPDPPVGAIGVAQPDALSFAALIRALSPRRAGPRTVPVPWQVPYGLLRLAERVGLDPPFRSDSLLGLVRAAPSVPHPEALVALGVTLSVLVDPAGSVRLGPS
jgi:nucleoside-diphosphate-sugar epimerase